MSADPPTPDRPVAESGQPPEVWRAIARSTPSDYDGHTEFDRMSPADRLAWMEAALRFIESIRRDRAP
jgi:hypothetical protein